MPQHRVTTHYRTAPDGQRVRVHSYSRHHDGVDPAQMSRQAREVVVVGMAAASAVLYLAVELLGLATTVVSVLVMVLSLLVLWWLGRSDNKHVRKTAKRLAKALRLRMKRKLRAQVETKVEGRIHKGPNGYEEQLPASRGRWASAGSRKTA